MNFDRWLDVVCVLIFQFFMWFSIQLLCNWIYWIIINCYVSGYCPRNLRPAIYVWYAYEIMQFVSEIDLCVFRENMQLHTIYRWLATVAVKLNVNFYIQFCSHCQSIGNCLHHMNGKLIFSFPNRFFSSLFHFCRSWRPNVFNLSFCFRSFESYACSMCTSIEHSLSGFFSVISCNEKVKTKWICYVVYMQTYANMLRSNTIIYKTSQVNTQTECVQQQQLIHSNYILS